MWQFQWCNIPALHLCSIVDYVVRIGLLALCYWTGIHRDITDQLEACSQVMLLQNAFARPGQQQSSFVSSEPLDFQLPEVRANTPAASGAAQR